MCVGFLPELRRTYFFHRDEELPTVTFLTFFISCRFQVANHVALLTKNSPLFDHSGAMPPAGRPADSVISYLSVHQGLAGKSKMYSGKYSQFVIDYATEWQRVVVTRCDKALKEAERLRVEVDHYQSKVESLRQSANEKMAKGKQVDQKSADKLTRNEEKLIKIKEENKKFSADTCLLVEELTERSWRDLHPLLIKIFQFEMTISTDEAKAMDNLKTVVHELKRLAASHGIKAEARLKDIENLAPSALSARGESDTLQIEAGDDGLSFSGISSMSNDMHYPAGKTALQGSGGFPVPISTSADDSVTNSHFHSSQQSGFSLDGGNVRSGGGGMSTVDMVAISAAAAPPPSMDQVQAAFGPSTSTGSFDSVDSGFSAPPPAAAPPPPPADGSNPFGAAPPAPSSYRSSSTNPFGQAPPSTPSSNPFGNAPAPSTWGSAAQTSPYPMGGAPPSSPYGAPMGGTAPSPYSQTPPPNAYGGGTPMSMYGNNSAPSSGNYSPAPPSYNQGYGQQPRSASTNPFE